ncbi:hypothetical protein [Streptomyces sp. NPDC059009]|uniref:hypothetical protein n=1 Tax=Streptomyces sp. NPDC059009 TaxID=3346694 RepID=UPI00367C528A
MAVTDIGLVRGLSGLLIEHPVSEGTYRHGPLVSVRSIQKCSHLCEPGTAFIVRLAAARQSVVVRLAGQLLDRLVAFAPGSPGDADRESGRPGRLRPVRDAARNATAASLAHPARGHSLMRARRLPSGRCRDWNPPFHPVFIGGFHNRNSQQKGQIGQVGVIAAWKRWEDTAKLRPMRFLLSSCPRESSPN